MCGELLQCQFHDQQKFLAGKKNKSPRQTRWASVLKKLKCKIAIQNLKVLSFDL